jgi:hypothetical protein
MKAGDKANGAKALAEASKELEKLMQQLGDAQSLMAELDALQKASMCVGSCQGWGKCNNPGFNPNGKRPGSGVGTWADENSGWMYDGQWNDHWDNSGIVRPDMDARGHTDRGDGELSDALKPTKVKGQFSPGGQMPSITLKGVSIKGTSKVAYEEAAAAAQSDAQSALSQEKVPRAYQGAVRDYFDDLKKYGWRGSMQCRGNPAGPRQPAPKRTIISDSQPVNHCEYRRTNPKFPPGLHRAANRNRKGNRRP